MLLSTIENKMTEYKSIFSHRQDSKYRNFSMGSVFNGDTFEDDLSSAIREFRSKRTSLSDLSKSLDYTDFEEIKEGT